MLTFKISGILLILFLMFVGAGTILLVLFSYFKYNHGLKKSLENGFDFFFYMFTIFMLCLANISIG